MPIEKWYCFDGGPITYWGQATEEQAKAYCALRAKRYPDVTYTEVAGEPDDEACTIINVDACLPTAPTEHPEPLKPVKPKYIYRPATKDRDHVGVGTPTIVYVLMKNRAEFDKIAAPLKDTGMQNTGRVLVKTVGELSGGKPYVIFQHWVVERDYVAERVAEMHRSA